MLERLIQWQVFDGHLGADRREVRLDLVDNDRLALERARERVPALADAHGWGCTEISEGWRLHRASTQLDVHFTVRDVRELARETDGGRHDVLIAHAFLDLFHLPTVVPALLRRLVPGGLFYFTLNYDGATIFEPVIDRSLEDAVQASYHNTMDNRMTAGQPSGDSAAGRHLYHVLTACGAEVVEFGSSDWVVFPRSGDYPGDEEYFLRCILWLVGTGAEGRHRSFRCVRRGLVATAPGSAARPGAHLHRPPTRHRGSRRLTCRGARRSRRSYLGVERLRRRPVPGRDRRREDIEGEDHVVVDQVDGPVDQPQPIGHPSRTEVADRLRAGAEHGG